MAPGPEVGHGSSDLTVAAAAWSLEVAEIFWLLINIFAGVFVTWSVEEQGILGLEAGGSGWTGVGRQVLH